MKNGLRMKSVKQHEMTPVTQHDKDGLALTISMGELALP